MPTWNEIYGREKMIRMSPSPGVQKLVVILEERFDDRPLRLWDLCCGTGRNTVFMAELGHDVYGSDNAPMAIEKAGEWFNRKGLKAELAVADMAVCPWDEVRFHGVVCWHGLQHNTYDNIEKTIQNVHKRLLPGGMLLLATTSIHQDGYAKGEKIEAGTFVKDDGKEKGIPHHYFTEKELRWLFEDWDLLVLAESNTNYLEKNLGEGFERMNPFRYSGWGVLAAKK
jgi:2-polyprenyl-3-methyl-5-hydroxy-6-metoxy-1,4-benzoquinol methylase